MRKIIVIFSMLFIFGCYPKNETSTPVVQLAMTSATPNPVRHGKAKNVILMIGDGMGVSQITAGMIKNNNRLNLERFPIVGLHKSYSSDNLITDSAAGATAFATGVKTYNGAIGVSPRKKVLKTILEECEEIGMATGMVSTSTIVHATPASFIAHQPSRKMYEEIAADFLKTEIDLFIGGGKKYFDRRETDERDLYKELEEKGYHVSDYFKENMSAIKFDPNKNFAYFTSDDDPLPVASGRDYLYGATRISTGFLKARSKEKGYFLMIEGAQIDWGGHANDANYIISEMLDFDKSIGAVLDWAEKDGETLVVVTADHETGGFSINLGTTQDTMVTEFTTDYHTAEMIPVFAYGPGSENFSGIYENTAIYDKIKKALGL
jgi:alkaline phosphatase